MNLFAQEIVRLAGPADINGFLAQASDLLAREIRPDEIDWRVEEAPAQPIHATPWLWTPPAFRELASRMLLHRDPARHALTYRLLRRLRDERRLLGNPADADVARAELMARAVRRDMHKMTAFVRFRRAEARDGGEAFVAWFEPDHHIVEATAPFFARRFSNMRWSILTPARCVHWDGAALAFTPGAERRNAPDGDALEDVWRAYYTAIFNPARLNLKAMAKEMPKKYWRNLPEAELIAPLTKQALARAGDMIAAAPTSPRRSAPAAPAMTIVAAEACDTLAELKEALPACVNCDLYRHATQVVPGEGSAQARIVFVGEQPGDEEDLTGRPFVGPAGRLLNTALDRVGIDRTQTYVTNAVKHFRFEPRGKKRIHKNPGAREIAACRGWLVRELELVRPRLVVALGATAAGSLLGKATPLRDVRGRTIRLANGLDMRATVHPSYLLRLIDEDDKKREWRALLADLQEVRALAEA